MQGANDTFVSALQRLLMQLSARAIALDPHTARELSALAGRVAEIHCLEPDLRWHLSVAEEHIDFATGPAEQPNVALTGSAKGLLQTLITGSSADVAGATRDRVGRSARPGVPAHGGRSARDSPRRQAGQYPARRCAPR